MPRFACFLFMGNSNNHELPVFLL